MASPMPICAITATAAVMPTWAAAVDTTGSAGIMGVQTLKGSGLGRMPSATLLTDTTRYIRGTTTAEGRSPICASVRTLAPFMDPNITGLVIKLRVVPGKVIYAFDWARGSTVYRVDLNGWNGTNQLRLTGLASAELKLKLTTAPNRAFTSTLGMLSGCRLAL